MITLSQKIGFNAEDTGKFSSQNNVYTIVNTYWLYSAVVVPKVKIIRSITFYNIKRMYDYVCTIIQERWTSPIKDVMELAIIENVSKTDDIISTVHLYNNMIYNKLDCFSLIIYRIRLYFTCHHNQI